MASRQIKSENFIAQFASSTDTDKCLNDASMGHETINPANVRVSP
jgi:hypothetical protein